MISHIIVHVFRPKGKGRWVLALPIIISLVLFVFCSGLEIDDRYIGGLTMLLSCLILLKIDDKPEETHEGVIKRMVKPSTGKNTLAYIEMRYWAIAFGLIGLILLLKDYF